MQLYDRRIKYAKTEVERKKLQEIDESFMTEESSSESENVVKRHQLQWRSNGETTALEYNHKIYFCFYFNKID